MFKHSLKDQVDKFLGNHKLLFFLNFKNHLPPCHFPEGQGRVTELGWFCSFLLGKEQMCRAICQVEMARMVGRWPSQALSQVTLEKSGSTGQVPVAGRVPAAFLGGSGVFAALSSFMMERSDRRQTHISWLHLEQGWGGRRESTRLLIRL